MAERIVMGMDGGNTSCRVVLANTAGKVLEHGQLGPVSVDGVNVETATRHIREKPLTRHGTILGIYPTLFRHYSGELQQLK